MADHSDRDTEQTPRSKYMLYPYYVALWGTFGGSSFRFLSLPSISLSLLSTPELASEISADS